MRPFELTLMRLLWMVALAVALSSCIGARPPTPAPAVSSIPRTPAPATGIAPGGLAHVTLGDGLASLSSYRATFVLTATSFISSTSGIVNARLTMTDERAGALDAQRVVYIYSDTLRPGSNQSTEQIRLGDSSFLVMDRPGAKSCIAQPVRQPGRWELVPFAYADLGDLRDATYAGEETLALPAASVRARHYVVERSLLGDFSSGHADVWIASEGGYVARLRAEASGTGPFQSNPKFQGRLVAWYEISQINQPISIVPPSACIGNLPIMPGAEEMSVAGNLVAYKVKASISAAVEFYIREMGARGWASAGEPGVTEDVTTLTFRRDSQMASVLLTPAIQGDVVQVVIIVTPAG